MKKLFYVLGTIALVIVVAGGIGIGVLIHNGSALDAEAKAFVDSVVPAIGARWDKDDLLGRATPELREYAKPDDVAALFQRFSQLGALMKYEGSQGQALMAYNSGSGSAVSATFTAKAKFQNGDATFRVALVKRDGQWMIQNFYVDAPPVKRTAQGT